MELLKTIKKGTVKTYKQIAIAINRPKSARAVANAVGKNPFPPKIPCHRVIRSDGSLGGYSAKGGVKTKKTTKKRRYNRLELLFDGRFSNLPHYTCYFI